jgi:hypothetical protein
MDEDENLETAAELECEFTDVACALVNDHDYSEEDLHGILAGTVFG